VSGRVPATGGDAAGEEAGEPAPFQVLGSERPFRGHLVGVRVDRIRGPDGRAAKREVVEHPGAVAALVLDDAGRVLLVEQWRQALGRRVLEVPAGKYDVGSESVEATLRRELAEEAGVEGGRLTWLTTFATTPGWSDEICDLFLVEGARPIAGERPAGDWEEAGLEVVALGFDEALRLAAGGGIGDGKTLVALGLYGLLRTGAWAPDPAWRPPPDAPARRAAARPPAG
jgi:8-oxo-dGTP pyrophosphatase MutT (NUDIX family)